MNSAARRANRARRAFCVKAIMDGVTHPNRFARFIIRPRAISGRAA
jgi:hypothetical protein